MSTGEMILSALPSFWEAVAIIAGPGLLVVIAKGWFQRPKTGAEAKKTESQAETESLKGKADAALVVIEGWEKLVTTLRKQMKEMQDDYEAKITKLEEKMDRREEWFRGQIEARDNEIKELRSEVLNLTGRLQRYEGMRERADKAEQNIKDVVAHEMETVKEPPKGTPN